MKGAVFSENSEVTEVRGGREPSHTTVASDARAGAQGPDAGKRTTLAFITAMVGASACATSGTAVLGRLAVAVGFVEPLGEPAVLALGVKKVASLVKL